MRKGKVIRIGFDFDGVIAYNPFRIIRFPIALFKKVFLHKKTLKFYYPGSELEKKLWILAHESSYFPAKGFSKLRRLIEDGKIEAYIVTGRYSFLEKSLKRWLRRYKAENLFKEYYINKKDEQSHLFKEKMIKKLDLDYFVEDNLDIVNHLSSRSSVLGSKFKTEVHWIYNILDRFEKYEHKYPHLEYFLKEIERKLK